jgi:ABC-2 type transport system ATP-binding protein
VSDATGPRLVLDHVSKRFGQLLALDAISLTLQPGEILGFVGPNGAGKTTAIRILLGLLRATGGRGSLLGRPLGDAGARARVGYVPDTPVFFPGNAIEQVSFAARLNGVRPTRARIQQTLERVGVHEWRRDVRAFSRGMQQRVALAQAIVHQPAVPIQMPIQVLILDEPAAALDPVGVVEVRTLLRELRAQGTSILFSSHQLTEVEEISDRIAFLRDGRLLRCGTLAELGASADATSKQAGSGPRVRVVLRNVPADSPLLQRFAPYQAAYRAPAGSEAGGERAWLVPAAEQRALIEAGWSAGAELVWVEPEAPSLAELYLEWSKEPDSGRGEASGK